MVGQIEKINEVSIVIVSNKSYIGLIKDQISNLEPRVLANETKINNVISEVEFLKNIKASNPDNIIGEIKDSSQRAKMLYITRHTRIL